MASILPFARKPAASLTESAALATFLGGFSIEVMPRTAARIRDLRAILPAGTRVYVAHVDGVDPADMVASCRRLRDEGFAVMPHVPARGLRGLDELDRRLAAYADVGVSEALAIAGGIAEARGPFPDTMSMLETGRFDARGFTRIHVAGHPEGSRDIDPAGGEDVATAALLAKNAFARRTDAAMAIVTQFAFEAEPVIAWADRLRAAGVCLPIHVGVAGPAKLQTMIKYAMTCGVGASLRVLQRRAADLANLLLPFEPTDILAALARRKAQHPDCLIAGAHLFPLGGVAAAADYANAAVAAPLRAGMTRLGLLFDLDGTLVDTDLLHFDAFAAMLAATNGRVLSMAEYKDRVMGRPNTEIAEYFFPGDPRGDDLVAQKEARFRDSLAASVPPVAGAHALLDWAAAVGAGVAVVTNAPRANAEAMLGAAGLATRFDTVIVGEECARPKPDPLPYREAMRRLGVTPSRSVAFEDSRAGLRAARASGAEVFGLSTGLPTDQLLQAGAHRVIPDFTDPELWRVLQTLKAQVA